MKASVPAPNPSSPPPRVVSPWRFATIGAVTVVVVFASAVYGTNWAFHAFMAARDEQIVAAARDIPAIGFLTIGEACDYYGVPIEAFYARFNLPPFLPPGITLKDVKTVQPKFSIVEAERWLVEEHARRRPSP
ncbi:MAG: hypothetical protein NZ518_02355 [Dehalococcoidia bacterium]|nr:hypothetical protein [Dehalococcoidia bacterium]